MHSQPLNILLIDDDDVVAEGIERSLRRSNIAFRLVWAEDGQIALDILRDHHPQRPLLILLDLKMPRMDGFEFLRQLRLDPILRREVVFVFTTSEAASDIRRAYLENVAGYVVKSQADPYLVKLATLLDDYAQSVSLLTEETLDVHDQNPAHR